MRLTSEAWKIQPYLFYVLFINLKKKNFGVTDTGSRTRITGNINKINVIRCPKAIFIGWRKSIDIDMVGNHPVDEISLTDSLQDVGQVRVLSKSKNILIYTIRNKS